MALAAISAHQIVMVTFAFAFGLVVGSFLNVCIWRLPRGESISHPSGSHCPRCKEPLRGLDNIPLLSFLLLGGRCRYCGDRISWRYPIVEGLTGLLYVLLYLFQRIHAGTNPGHVLAMGLVIALLVAASGVDFEFLIIPDEISLYGLLGGLLAGAVMPGLHVGNAPYHTLRPLVGIAPIDGLIGALIGAIGGGGLVLLFAVMGALVFRKEAMGLGDVKLMAMVGAFLGWKVALIAFFLAPFFGLVYGLPLLLLKDEHTMPYGPFLSGGAVLTILLRGALCEMLNRYLEVLKQLVALLIP